MFFLGGGVGGAELGAVEVLDELGIPSTGGSAMAASDIYDLYVGTGVFSMINTISDLIGMYVRDGTLENRDYMGGVESGWADFVFEHPELVPPEAFQKVFVAKIEFGQGTLQLPYIPEETPPDWTFPTIPHGLEGRESCSTCHDVNQLPQEAPAHGWLTDGNCLSCHAPEA
jgi:hypothetical protein